MFSIAYAGEHEQLRCIEGTATEDNLTTFSHAILVGLGGRRVMGGVGMVKFLAAQKSDANSPKRWIFFKEDLGYKAPSLDHKPFRVLCLDLEEKLSRTRAMSSPA